MNACPRKCITMNKDEEGFSYPIIDADKCVDCGICESVCPIKNPYERKKADKAYIVRNNDNDVLESSSSGGFFSATAGKVIEKNGIVCGVVFDSKFSVVHIVSSKEEDLIRMRGSKYVQSELGFLFSELKQKLEEGVYVCFVGTPCQVEGFRKFLRKEYSNLICIDFVCHGVSSPMVWEHYVKELETRFASKMKFYSFRSKHSGHHNFGTYSVFENGQEYRLDDKTDEKDFMHLAYFNEICSRPSCHACAFKTLERASDITMFDCWHPTELAGIVDDDRGYSTVIPNTKNGEIMLRELADELFTKEISLSKSIELDGGNAVFSMIPSSRRDNFLRDVKAGTSTVELSGMYFKEKRGTAKRIRKILVSFLKKTHIFSFVRKTYYSIRGKMASRRM